MCDNFSYIFDQAMCDHFSHIPDQAMCDHFNYIFDQAMGDHFSGIIFIKQCRITLATYLILISDVWLLLWYLWSSNARLRWQHIWPNI